MNEASCGVRHGGLHVPDRNREPRTPSSLQPSCLPEYDTRKRSIKMEAVGVPHAALTETEEKKRLMEIKCTTFVYYIFSSEVSIV